METDSLPIKYRPRRLEQVCGQGSVVKSLQAALAKQRGRTFLFTGPSGVGKTTLARLVAKELGCTGADMLEIDGATHSGVDDVRELTNFVRFKPLSGGSRAVILDECHALSRQAWQALLKATEEPPQHAIWIFCTTEVSKVPKTLQTRCLWYGLSVIDIEDLFTLVTEVAELEGMKVSEEMRRIVAQGAEGSARRALQLLAQAEGCKDAKALRKLIEHSMPETQVIEFCRELHKKDWKACMAVLRGLEDTDAETVRIIVQNYYGKWAMNEARDKQRLELLQILEEFSTPCHPGEKLAPIVRATGRYIFG
jgi:DNA polymerase III subunit gamma/tau